jgi:hypothetical protein
MTTCADIRDGFMHGQELPSEVVRAHLLGCSACQGLFGQGAELGRSLARQANARVPFPDLIFSQIEQTVARETGFRAWLRARPTKLRFVLASFSVLLVVLLGGVLELRPDFGEYPALRVVWLLGAYLITVFLAFRLELTLPARRSGLAAPPELLLGALGLPFLIAFLPATEAARLAGPGGALNCFIFGTLLTVPTAVLLWALDRDDSPSLRTVCLSAVALGLSADSLLELHCPNGNPTHLLLGHASIGLSWLAAWFVARRSLRVFARPR